MGRVKKQFYTVAKPKCWMPAKEFEGETGLTGISGDYKFPHGLSADEYEGYVSYASRIFDCYLLNREDYTSVKTSEPDPALMEKMRKDWDDLVTLNPALKKVSVDKKDGNELQLALEGAAS